MITHKINEKLLVRLTSGEHVIGKKVGENADTLSLSNPLLVFANLEENGTVKIQFDLFAPFSDVDSAGIPIQKTAIQFMSNPTKELTKAYNDIMFGVNIEIPEPAKLIIS